MFRFALRCSLVAMTGLAGCGSSDQWVSVPLLTCPGKE